MSWWNRAVRELLQLLVTISCSFKAVIVTRNSFSRLDSKTFWEHILWGKLVISRAMRRDIKLFELLLFVPQMKKVEILMEKGGRKLRKDLEEYAISLSYFSGDLMYTCLLLLVCLEEATEEDWKILFS